MRSIKIVMGTALLIMSIGIIGCFKIIKTPYEQEVDVVALNSIMQVASRTWGDFEKLKVQEFDYDYVIFDAKGKRVYASTELEIDSLETAIKQKQSMMNVIKEGEFLGTVVAYTNDESAVLYKKKQIVWLVISIGLIEGMILVCYSLKIYYGILKPFDRLKNFAHEVAKGNLDLPLEMDKEKVFGAFTESFDLMREELKLAKKNEYAANKSKKELIAALSHDIKTPVTGIKLISELLEIQVDKPELKEKVNAIYNKAGQIDALITNMFESTLEELGEFKVEVKDEEAWIIGEMFNQMNHDEKIHQGEIPECLIYIDRMRMEQMINNIISNSYKYAGTDIAVNYVVIPGYLQIDVKDYGKGVAAAELPLIFNKFYRSKESNVQEKAGTGLGLYISKVLIEKMNGEINCFNTADGFIVRVLIPLSCIALEEL